MKVIKGGKDKGKLSKKPPRYDHDWEAIENDLLTTTRSIKAIARKHKVSDTAIRKYIKKNGIERDLSLKVKAAVRNKLVRDPIRKPKQVRTKPQTKPQTKKLTEKEITEKEIVEAAAEESISFIKAWDEIFLKTVAVAKVLKKEILKKVKVKIEPKDGKRGRTISVDKLDSKEKATVFNSVVKAETSVFESMRKNLGIGDDDQSADRDLGKMNDIELDKEIEELESNEKAKRA